MLRQQLTQDYTAQFQRAVLEYFGRLSASITACMASKTSLAAISEATDFAFAGSR